MPIPITERSDSNISPQRIKKLEQEVNRLRKEIGALRGNVDGENHGGAIMGWVTTMMAAFGAIMGLIALFHH